MMVVQPGERNAFDQRWIEYNLLKKYENNLIYGTLSRTYDIGDGG
jgi:glutathione synthase